MPHPAGGQEPAPMDDLDRELRELTEGRAGEPLFLEPSAAERARAGAVRVREAPAALAGARAGRRRRRHSRRRRRAGGGPPPGSVAVAVFLLLACGLAWLRFPHARSALGGGARGAASGPGTAASAGLAAALGTISPGGLFDGPPTDPFLGSPADGWADGAAGIVGPAARPAGGFTAAQVAAAYAATRKLLIAAGLDRQTLLGGPPAAFARLLVAAQRATFLAGLDKRGLAKDGSPLSTRTWVTSFAPGSAALVGTVIKVHGTMSARAVTESGAAVLTVDVSYLFAYAVEPPHDPAGWTRVVSHLNGSVDFAWWDDPGGPLEPWDRTVVETTGLRCGTGNGYIYPVYPGGRSAALAASGPVINLYPAAAPAPGGAACAAPPSR
jgi:hypothetical protein